MEEEYLPIPLTTYMPIYFKISLNVLIFTQKRT